ncbi:MAG: type II toxin-antitoxin system PemK/MazF family toxin [Candidatus Kapabacteria bacterium]|jgi:mRNA interferase MazF|nr:type II toxin-antitoxin system PemK/MazF family toxin [Candidatus Kapabacteria bacterium]
MRRGEVWLVDFAPQVGTEITKQRPAVIVSVNGIAAFPTRLVVPFRERKPFHSTIAYYAEMQPSPTNGLTKASTADCVQTKSLDQQRFIRKLGELSPAELQSVMDGVALCLGL